MNSMNLNGFGLALRSRSKEFDYFCDKFIKACEKDVPEIEDDRSDYDLTDDLRRLGSFLLDEFYEGKKFDPVYENRGECFENDDMLVFWADHQPEPFRAVYTEESIVEEFQKKLGAFLPDGFDYLAHIGYFSASACV